MSAYFHLKPSGTQYMFNLKAGNGEAVLTSERYTTKQSAEGGIASVKVNSPHDTRYDRRTNSAGSTRYRQTTLPRSPTGYLPARNLRVSREIYTSNSAPC